MEYFDYKELLTVTVKIVLSVLVGGLIGSERFRNGRAAGMRTHILVCMGAALTAMMGLYVSNALNEKADVLRLSAQVVSGVGFLGAGMIILRNNHTITGLTTAAGVWTTSVLGIAVGYGFYFAAIVATVTYVLIMVFLKKYELHKRNSETVYIELDDMYHTNEIVEHLRESLNMDFSYDIIAAKSNNCNHIGVNMFINAKTETDFSELCGITHIVFASKEN